MRTAVCLLLLIASAVSAFTDFHGLSGPHKRVELSDGTVHLSQDVHHKFEEHGTFFKATYTARHEAKWNFVELSSLDPEFSMNLRCGSVDSTDDLEIRRPSASMLKAFEAVKSGNIIVTASPQFHCHSKPIFRHLLDIQVTTHSVILKTTPAAYQTVFQDLQVRISTNHVFQSSRNSSVSTEPVLLTHTRGFHTQHWWHHFTSAVSRAVHTVAHTLSHAATDVGHTVVAVAKTAIAVVGGDYSKDGVWNLPGINYNKDSTGAMSAKQIVHADYSAGASFVLTPTIHFDLDIKTWHLRNLEVYFEGDAEASLSAHFGATLQKTISDSRQVVDIQLDAISFMIGVVPIVIKPSIPINVGFELNIDGQLEVGATLHASGSVKHGFAYSPSTGHRTISESSFTFTHDFNPKTYSVSVGITAWVQPVLTVSIDGILHGGVGAAIYADVLVQSNPQCIFDLTVNARPVVSVMASIGVSIAGHDLFDESWGPLTVWTHTYPLYAYCKPNPFQSDLSSHRAFSVQNASTVSNSSAVTVTQTVTLVNRKIVNRTILSQLDEGNVGKIWTGRSVSCGTTDLHYSLRFAMGDAENSSLVILTVTKVRPSLVAMGQGYATATAQIFYQSPSLPSVGVMQTYVVTNQSDAYVAATNETEMGVTIPSTFTLIFSPSDIRYASLDSTLTCGPVSLEALEVNDNDKVFDLLGASPNSAAATSDSAESANSSNVALIAVIAVASTLAIVAVIAAVFIHRKRAVPPPVQEREEKMQNLSSLLNDASNEKEESGEI